MSDDDKTGLKGDDKILQEAKDRFRKCEEWEGRARTRFIEDTKFCEGDSDNNYQWDDTIRNGRVADRRPCLTINKTRQHCLQIVNDARQNKAQIRLIPVGDGATYESAKIFEGVARHIEYISNALEAYESATWRQVTGGWGYWRVITDYVDDKSLDQEIYIKRVPDPLSVYLDPDIQQFDGSDARYGFVFKDWERSAFKAEFPDVDIDDIGNAPLEQRDAWLDPDKIRVAEYFRKVETREELVLLPGSGEAVRKSALVKQYPDVWKQVKDDPDLRTRWSTSCEIEWYKLAGNKIIEKAIWPGIYIPLVRCVGEETIIDGELDRKGHTRALKDPQRMYNYQSSAMVEFIALQSKSPFITPVRAVEGLETYWNDANAENRAYLPYNDVDDEGRPVAPPQRHPPPQMPAAYIEAMKVAQTELMMASGQWQAQMGQNENAKSGVAIEARQRQGDNATYHYIDHLAQAIKFTGKILIDLIPKIYDTPRIIKIMAEDGDQSEVHIDPEAPKPFQMAAPGPMGQMQPVSPDQAKRMQGDPDVADKIKTIFNPNVGRYDVEADIGPAYATKRQEGFNAISQILQHNPQLVQVAGDLMMRAADFPMADELAERLKRMVPPQILGEGPPPQVAEMQQQFQAQMQHMQQVIGQLIQQNAEKDAKLRDKSADSDVKTYDAETRRIAAMANVDPEALKPVVRQLVSEALGTPIVPLMAAHAHAENAFMPGDPMADPEQPQEAAE